MNIKITKKICYLALGLLCLAPQLRADDAKVDYTDYLKNPSFEFMEDGVTVLDVTDASNPLIVGSALRGTPPGWSDTGVNPPATGNLSYGINRNSVNKDGFNAAWCAANPFPETYALYQEVTNLPAGEYVFSCAMWVSSARLTNQRFFVQTNLGANVTNNLVQYFGSAMDYDQNLTEGETNTFANWEMGTGVGDGDSRLKPMSIVVNISDGETLVLGVRSGNWKMDGSRNATQEGFFKVDNFRIKRVVAADPNDFSFKIKNPSFELMLDGEGNEVQIKSPSIADAQRGTPYGWLDEIVDATPIGTSYGVNSDANGMDGAKAVWALRTPFVSSFMLYQDITGLSAGKYEVSCAMFVEDGKITSQHLFANNKAHYYATALDYLQNLNEEEVNTFAGLTTSPNAFQGGFFLKNMSVEVDVQANETLRIGIKSGNMKADGTISTASEGWFKADNFRLKRLVDFSGLKNTTTSNFNVDSQKDGFFLNFENATPAQVRVLSLSGQSVYVAPINSAKTWISLPQGLYIAQVTANGVNSAVKVLVK